LLLEIANCYFSSEESRPAPELRKPSERIHPFASLDGSDVLLVATGKPEGELARRDEPVRSDLEVSGVREGIVRCSRSARAVRDPLMGL
jgi:hypothetical protein